MTPGDPMIIFGKVGQSDLTNRFRDTADSNVKW